jgi:hypothetical protein
VKKKHGLGLATLAPPKTKELFAAATKVNIGDRKKVSFWEASWLYGRRPMDIAPLIFESSKRKKSSVYKAMEGDFWVSQINIQHGLSLDHLVQFTNLWEMLQSTTLVPNTPDTILWKLTNDGCYS